MKFTETKIAGVFVIELERHEDDRAWCREEFAAHGLPTDLAQTNLSHNTQRGTVRGMHFQTAPHAEAKLVRYVAGTVHDVALDLRTESPTFKQSFAIELSAANSSRHHARANHPRSSACFFNSITNTPLIFVSLNFIRSNQLHFRNGD